MRFSRQFWPLLLNYNYKNFLYKFDNSYSSFDTQNNFCPTHKINLKLVEVWNQIENSWKGNPENFFLDKVKQEAAEWCPLYYFFSRNHQTSTNEYCSKLVILFEVPMGILLSFWRYLTYTAIWTMLVWASTLSEDSNNGNWSKYLTLHGWEVLILVALVTAWIARISQLTALTDLKFSFLNAKLFGDRETP